ncbi:MAG TPA: biotin transporter BioY [Candidatus Faeciplasma avium]|uniref:Biotin transporter n=1 Tax=Candidatus Faeciplasma avium TaxID=2840798 RepID=A0A9D1NPX8_9FIRM|nr:biotin transporter BioY [Candidatus Faeciplasma avium]
MSDMKNVRKSTQLIALTGMAAAVLCIMAPWQIAIGPIPITLATFAIYIISSLLDWQRASIATGIYILLGMVGLPVFAGFKGGFHVVFGVTGGYIVGYVFLALINAAVCSRLRHWIKYPIGMLLGTAVLYAFGTAWYCVQSGSGLIPALAACVLPFLGFDILKIAAASLVAMAVKPALSKLRRA